MSHRSSPRPSSMGRRQIKTWEEQDVHTGWRRWYCTFNRSGASAKAKRRTRQRERLEAKRALAEEISSLGTFKMRLDVLFKTFKDGDEIGWNEAFEYLAQVDPEGLRELIYSVIRDGMREPILLGFDGRVWDGHHRLYAARALGLTTVPVQYA